MSQGRSRLRDEKKSKENGTCLENCFDKLPGTVCGRSSACSASTHNRQLLAAGLTLPALAVAQSVPYPTYVTGPQPNGSWVVSSGQVITPAGTQVNLGIRVRAKAIALNPNAATHTAAVLTMGTSAADGNGAVEVFDTNTGAVLQNYTHVRTGSERQL